MMYELTTTIFVFTQNIKKTTYQIFRKRNVCYIETNLTSLRNIIQ
jgi:hypothetical protein